MQRRIARGQVGNKKTHLRHGCASWGLRRLEVLRSQEVVAQAYQVCQTPNDLDRNEVGIHRLRREPDVRTERNKAAPHAAEIAVASHRAAEIE